MSRISREEIGQLLEHLVFSDSLRLFFSILLFLVLQNALTGETDAHGQTIPQPPTTLNFQLSTGEDYATGTANIETEQEVITATISATDAGESVVLHSLGSITATVAGYQPFDVGITRIGSNSVTAVKTISAEYRRGTSPGGQLRKLEQLVNEFTTEAAEQSTGEDDLLVTTFARGNETFVQIIRQESGLYFLQLRSSAANATLGIADSSTLTEEITYQGPATTKLTIDYGDEVPEQPDKSMSIEMGAALPLEIRGHRILLTVASIDFSVSPHTITGTVESFETGEIYSFSGSDPNTDLIITVGEISFSLLPTQGKLYFLPLISR